ncbi:MAG: glutamate-5-semialdehyde dehydrogenase, partial [Actinomycetota bacterium]
MTIAQAVCRRAKDAAPDVALLSSETKDAALHAMAVALESSIGTLIEANAEDVRRAEASGTSRTLIDRLTLTEARVTAMADG